MPISATSIQHRIGSASQSNKVRKRNRGIQIEKEEGELPLLADMILFLESPKDYTHMNK